MKILLFSIFCQCLMAQVGTVNRFFFAKENSLYYFDGAKTVPIVKNLDQLTICFPYFLRNGDLYQVSIQPVVTYQLIARGVTKVFNNHYLIRDKLYTIINSKGTFVADNVTDVYDSCPDPHYPNWGRRPGETF